MRGGLLRNLYDVVVFLGAAQILPPFEWLRVLGFWSRGIAGLLDAPSKSSGAKHFQAVLVGFPPGRLNSYEAAAI